MTVVRFHIRERDAELRKIVDSFPAGTASSKIREAIIRQHGKEDDIEHIKETVDRILEVVEKKS